MNLKKINKYVIKHYYYFIFLSIFIIASFISIFKFYFSKQYYVYAELKVSQGLWWASTAKPSIWFIDAIKKGDTEKDFIGKPAVQVIKVQYYPWWGSDQFDIYLTLKLKVSKNKNNDRYTFNRATISIGSPLDLELTSGQISGTIINLSEKPFQDKSINKIIYMIKRGGYNKDFPYTFDGIKMGDKYFDGEDYVFEVLDKSLEKNIWSVANMNAQIYERPVETAQDIVIKARIKVQQRGNQLIFAKEQIIKLGKKINISTPDYNFEDYVVAKIK